MKLIPISLRCAERHECKNIKPGRTRYLCKIDGEYFVGRFQREWFGLHFDGWCGCGIQFDAPGYNSSDWERVWRIET